jgi:CBS-domain-containing membrane protein
MAGEDRGLHASLLGRFGARGGEAIYIFFASLLALGVSGLAAYLLRRPLIFPSLGPTAYLFFEQTHEPPSSPRNALIGHAVAILSGAFCLFLFGLLDNASTLQEGVTPARVGAAALSLAITGAVLLLLDAQHPPAGATVLVVSLGFLQTPGEMAALMAGVVLLTLACWIINRALGVRAPAWSAKGEQ